MKYRLNTKDSNEVYLIEDKLNIYYLYHKEGELKVDPKFKYIEIPNGPLISQDSNINDYNEKLPSMTVRSINFDNDKEMYYIEVEDGLGKQRLYDFLSRKAELDACHALADFYDD